MLSDDDKITYNINVCLDLNGTNIDQYRDNRYKHLINQVICKGSMDLDALPDHGIRFLSLVVDDAFKSSKDKLPESLKRLQIDNRLKDKDVFKQNVDRFVYTLPYNLKVLSITLDYKFTNQCILPQTLEEFNYCGNVDSLSWVVVPQQTMNKVLKGCILRAKTIEDLQWLHDKT